MPYAALSLTVMVMGICLMASGDRAVYSPPPSQSDRSSRDDGDAINAVFERINDLLAERVRRRIYHPESDPRVQDIDRQINEIHQSELADFEIVATDAGLIVAEEPQYGQPSYGVLLKATARRDIAANELLLFTCGRIYRSSITFPKLTTRYVGWYFKPDRPIKADTRFVVACLQNAPEELENVRNGFMPDSDRARNPNRAYDTEIYSPQGAPYPIESPD